MDFTGLGRFTAYRINRPLTDEEKSQRLDPKRQLGKVADDYLSAIRINSTYMDLVDRWYGVKGFAVWIGLMIAVGGAYGLGIVLWGTIFCDVCVSRNSSGIPSWVFAIVLAPLTLPILWGGLYGFFLEAFRRTHYPIRINRKTRQVHAMRLDGSVLTVSWEKLFLCIAESSLPLAERSVDIRAHVLADDGETVKETFTLGYVPFADRDNLLKLWEYIRRYMETPDGVERNFRETELCLPIDGRREGLLFGLVRSFAPLARVPVMQLVASPVFALNTWGRWVAMYTSKTPQWPAEVEAANEIAANDPYRKNWRSNGPYTLAEWLWPAICFLTGSCVVAWVIYELLSAILAS